MRIVAGKYRGRALAAPRGGTIRPTADRTREALFNILGHGYPRALEGSRVLDLFAGSGGLGFEALSRGAAFALFIERSVEGCRLLRANRETLGAGARARILRRDATALGARHGTEPFDLVLADPPYGQGLGERALAGLAAGGWLADGALAVIEERGNAAIEPGKWFRRLETRNFGIAAIHLHRFAAARPAYPLSRRENS